LKTKPKVDLQKKRMTYPPFFKEYAGGIVYLNLCSYDSCEYAKFKTLLPRIQKAKGIIMDVRGYPSSNCLSIISHFLKDSIMLGNIHTQTVRFPDRQYVEYPLSEKWGVFSATSALSKKYAKKYEYPLPNPISIQIPMAFLTNTNAQSFAETFMDMIKAYHVGTIIGAPTAGCNGDVTFINQKFATFPMTYYKVFNPDGSAHHSTGILPDIYCVPTMKDIQQGIDTELERAKKYLYEKLESANAYTALLGVAR